MKNNILVCGKTDREITEAYRDGAQSFRRGLPDSANPHSVGHPNRHEWQAGYDNELDCQHVRFGIDVVGALPTGCRFEEDPGVRRNGDGTIDEEWYMTQLAAAAQYLSI